MRCAITLLVLVLASACSNTPATFENSYTAENTYLKYQQEFPFIEIASTEVPADVVEQKNIAYVRYGDRELQLDLLAI